MLAPTPSPSTVCQRSSRLLTLVAFVCLWALIPATFPAAAQSEEEALRQQLEQVEAEQAELTASLHAATARVDDLTARLAQIRDRADQLRAEIGDLAEQEARARKLIDQRVVAMYKGGSVSSFASIASGKTISDITRRTHYLSAMTRTDAEHYEQAQVLIATTEARRAELGTVDRRLDQLVAEAADARADLDAKFEQAAAAHQEITGELAEAEAARIAAEEEAARQAALEAAARELAAANAAKRRAEAAAASRSAAVAPAPAPAAPASAPAAPAPAPAPPSTGGKACPQDNPRSFTDTWGAPRSGGRTHQGTDIFGTRGGNVFAIVDGTVEWLTTGETSGLFLSLRGDDGNTYWYMHLQDFVASEGQRVSAGELIAHNGDTGNAQGTTPHIHFEYHPGGGGAINPYPLLAEIC